jgi:hypothetical protein
VLCWGSPVLGGLALTLYALQAEGWRAGLSVAGTALALAAAATAGGGLLGFLFGIPRTLQHTPAQATKPAPTERGEEQAEERKQAEEPKDEAQPGLEYGANTNLEEISDWLTKILVGVGLTQIAGVRPALASYAKSVAPALGGFDGAGTFAVAWLLYFAACGFLMGYVATRLHFAPALRHADVETRLERLTSVTEQSQAELARVTTKVSELEDQAQRDAQALALVQRQLEPGTDATPISEAELADRVRQASDSARRQILSMAREVRRDNWHERERKPRMERTIPVFRALIATDPDRVYHAYRGQLGYALKDKLDPDWSGAEDMLTQAIEIRGDWHVEDYQQYEANRAYCRIRQDPALHRGPSAPATKDAIWADISALASAPTLLEQLASDPDVVAWLEANGLDLNSLRGQSPWG